MVVFKCKMCGGDLHPETESTTCECEFCGTMQTVPTDDGEKKTNLFNRANRLRMNAEFDKAAAVYESIAAEYPEEAEAYWGLCLCAYGIEYVDDPATGEKKPTCHRTLPTPIMEDANFEQACDNADAIARRVYREEAKAINRIQKDILSIVANETPYDVFICYKETADEGGRTEDSVLAQEIYDALTGKGLKVFFSRITLEDKLGQQYEPYIYAALSSAKIMLAIGTKYEYYDAVWVKNEWMRFLSMMKTEKGKTLIPCYKGIDAYDMPKEFKNLQGQDMGKLGWLQDLTRGIEKLLGLKTKQQNESFDQNSKQTEVFAKRARLFAEGSEWDKAIEYSEKALDINPENAQAYLAKELAERKCRNILELACFLYLHKTAEDDDSLKNARRFMDVTTEAELVELDEKIKTAANEMKKASAAKLSKEKSMPDWKERKGKLEYIRDRAGLLSRRISQDDCHTFVLNTDGKLFCTKTTNDKYGIYDGGKSACNEWTSKLYDFKTDYLSVYGLKIDGTFIRTQRHEKHAPRVSHILFQKWDTVSGWTKVKAFGYNYGENMVYGISEDGTVKAAGVLSDGCEYHGLDKVEHLTNIESYAFLNSKLSRPFFLSKDGTVKSSEYVGEDKYSNIWSEISSWTDINTLLQCQTRIAGIRNDGTIVFSSYFGDNEYPDGETIEAETWSGVVQCYKLPGRMVGLSETGKLLVTDYYGAEEEDPQVRDAFQQLNKWDNIAYLTFGVGRIIGIDINGDVKYIKCVGEKDYDQIGDKDKDLASWRQIVSIKAVFSAIVGVKKDGSVVAVGKNENGDTDVSGIRMFRNYDRIPEEISEGIISAKKEQEEKLERQREEERKQAEIKRLEEAQRLEAEQKQREEKKKREEFLLAEKDNLLIELSNLKGLFSGKRKREIQERLDMIERELNE